MPKNIKQKGKRFKKFLKKYKKVFNPFKLGIDNTSRIYIAEVNATVSLANTAAGIASVAMSFPLNSPTMYVTPGGVWTQLTTFSNQFTNMISMFDVYRVMKLRVKFIPNAVNTNIDTTVATNYQFCVHFVHDKDDTNLLANESNALSVSSYPHNYVAGRSVERIIKQQQNKKVWFNTQAYNTAPSTATVAGTILSPTFYESIKILHPVMPAATIAGDYYLTWLVMFSAIRAQ